MHRHIGIGNDVWIGYEAVIFSDVSNVLEMKIAKSCKNPFRCSERKHNDLSLISESLIQIAIHSYHFSVFFVVYTTILLVKSCKIVS